MAMGEQGDFFQFACDNQKKENSHGPLALRMRPKKLSQMVGQRHLLNENCILPKLIRRNSFGSLIFWGPPGCGKTSLAEAIANEIEGQFIAINAATSNVNELRNILQSTNNETKPPVLFIDEIHRFNRSQQDLLLPYIERNGIRLIGATTYTPSIYIIAPLLSRSHLFALEALDEEIIASHLSEALLDTNRGLGNSGCTATEEVLRIIASASDGDLRRALNHLEMMVAGVPVGSHISWETLENLGQERHLRYDRNQSEHHATISAYIKSMRGCDPDAAVYWLAKMLNGGEDPRFIARRLIIFASEDVGLADSSALPLAIACFDACEKVGLPECAINLSHVSVFMAGAPKSNSTYMALQNARRDIQLYGIQPVPTYLQNRPHSLAKKLGDESYRYAHDYENNSSSQAHMINKKQFYFPKRAGDEGKNRERKDGEY
ncbi:MAG: replication-associated recombination protein A [Puniceicoccales bacterium]|jgi:putative ATPase|nr:replication-associated recombination protein A [Puniceicoccales bacterium]